MKRQFRFDPSWILAVVLTVFAVAPLTYPGFFEAQSGFLPVFNVTHPAAAPVWGRPVDPVRGEGQLPYLLAWPFLQLSGSGIAAVKWGYGLAFVLGALGIYAWTRRWLGLKGGVLAAMVYTYLPWHLSAVYLRGAYGEAWLWALWPLLLWAIDRLFEGRPPRSLVFLALGILLLAATFWTQPGLAALAVPFFLAYTVSVPARQPRQLPRILGVTAFSLLLLWLAARRLPGTEPSFVEQFLHPFQLLSAAWGEGPSFQLGLAAVGLSIVAVALSTSNRTSGGQADGVSDGLPGAPAQDPLAAPPLRQAIWYWFGTLLLLVLLTLLLSAGLWKITGFGAFLAYPWQLLALTGLPLAFLAGAVIRLDGRLATLPAWAGLVALVLLASYPYLAPRFTQVDPGPEPVALFQPKGAHAPQILLLDYEIQPPTAITPTLTLTLTWQATEPVDSDYTVFVHLLAEGDTRVAQRDSRPCDQECPTNTWQPGSIVVDRHQLDLTTGSAGVSPGSYRLAMGLYVLDTDQRADVAGQEDETVYLDVP